MNINDNLPVSIQDNNLPIDKNKKYKELNNEEFYTSTSHGFIDTIFLASIMISCFMWGMLVAILK